MAEQSRRFLLSIDGGGGQRGRLSLLIIQNILHRIRQHRPGVQAYNLFDLAGGTGVGGLIVIMLFRLQMDIDAAIVTYEKLTKRVKTAPPAGIVNNLEGSRSSRLELCFGKLIKKHIDTVDTDRSRFARMFKSPIMVKQSMGSRAFTCAQCLQRGFLPYPDPDCFISWQREGNNWEKITIIDAARATCAFFKAITIKDSLKVEKTFNGNSLDPSRRVLTEAGTFDDQGTVLIAIGSGDGVGTVNDAGSIRFDVQCDVDDGWTSGDGTSDEAIAGWLSNNMELVIDDFVRLYLEGSSVAL